MLENHQRPYYTYSILIHFLFCAWITFLSFSKSSKKTYYSIDFFGGLPSSSRSSGVEAQKTKEEEIIKTKIINPQEDLLLKSKKKLSKNEKEVISSVPAPPPPPTAKVRGGNDNISQVPGILSGSGVGVGLGEGGLGGSDGAGNFPYTWYVHSIKKKLDSNWNVTSGFASKIYAQVVFTVNRDGSITDVKIEESSKNEIFDRAAIRAVEYSHPFPPLPTDFPESELRVHVRYTVKR